MTKRLLPCALFLLFVVIWLCPGAKAAEEPQQVELTATGTGYYDYAFLTDGDDYTYYTSNRNCTLTLDSQAPFSSLYLMFDLEFGEYTITDNLTGNTITAGQYSFLHDFVSLSQATTSVTLTFPGKSVRLSEISAFTEGIPGSVQVWQPPLEGETELMLMSTHGDDEQLYFAGLLPLYAGELEYKVQVVYLTDHRNLTSVRTHEMLNGLWKVGVTAYPVFGSFDDFRIDSLQKTYTEYARRGTSKNTLLDFVVTQLRRFKPQAVVGHDFAGEYGHGMHQVYADLLAQALELTNSATAFPDSAEQYGLWDVPKAYFHLYERNPIVLDYDQPLSRFHNMTAFDVSRKLGFPQHISQQSSTDFGAWVSGEFGEVSRAAQIETYTPCHFGLYRSTVGEDIKRNDFMENTPSYNERLRLEAERLAQEEAERMEAERLAQEEAERIAQEEAAKQAEEEAKYLEEKRLKEEAELQKIERQRLTLTIIIIAVVVVLVVVGTLLPKILRRPDTENPD